MLKVANWNIERVTPWELRVAAIQEHFIAVDADIWFLTETHQEVRPGVGYFSCFSAEPDRLSRSGERWVALWSRWQIEPLPTFVSDSARCAAGYIANSPFGELILFGGVLPWTNTWRGIPGANAQAFGAALAVQRHDWTRLAHHFPDATLIIAGDFNQDLAGKHYYGSRKKRLLLETALLETNVIPLTAGKNDPIARESSPNACIDHICISSGKNWKSISTERWPATSLPIRGLSDHFGVSVELVREHD